MGVHACNYCSYTSTRTYNLKVHIRNKHENNNNGVESIRAPVTMSIGENVEPAPTTVFVGNNQSNVAVGVDTASSSTSEDTPKVSSAMYVDMQHG